MFSTRRQTYNPCGGYGFEQLVLVGKACDDVLGIELLDGDGDGDLNSDGDGDLGRDESDKVASSELVEGGLLLVGHLVDVVDVGHGVSNIVGGLLTMSHVFYARQTYNPCGVIGLRDITGASVRR